MNLFHLNTGVDNKVLLNADYDIKRYTYFIKNAIDFLQRETLSIKVSKVIIDKETRYIPEIPQNKKAEKAIELLFNENTKAIYDQNKNFYASDSIGIIDQNEDENYIVLKREIAKDIIYLRPDTYQLEQQKRALDNLRYRPQKEPQPLLELFGYPDNRFWSQRERYEDFNWQILTDVTKDGIDEQRNFVSKAIQTKDFALLEGPPGSGKTTTIIELIMQFTAKGKRILLCSATHAAIDNVIERVKGRYKDICDKEIVPVRISRVEKPVKETVRPYLLKNLVRTYKAEIEKHLKRNQALESQKFLLRNLYKQDEKESDPIEKIILDSANLVAGTMIGILQHPDIRANKQGASFDVLIVDEASKVTFSDFIVPALHAKKWILVGDVKQLSPFVENDYVSENISQLLDEQVQSNIVKQFELHLKLNDNRYNDVLKVYFTEGDIDTEYSSIQTQYNDLLIRKVTNTSTDKDAAEINAADVLVCMSSGKVKVFLAKYLFVKAIIINGDFKREFDFKYRQHYLHHTELPEFTSKDEEWSEMVSSRLNQSFSFRNAEGFENIEKELNYLIPDKFKDDINQIKRLVFPSILELLQNGIGKGQEQKSNRVLSDGFDPAYTQSRFVSLRYQHRMHPDIAKTSKENFYTNNLYPANTVLEHRDWNYALNEPIVKWVHDNDGTGNKRGEKITNPTEANNIEKELYKFLDWAKNNPRINSEGKVQHYEVAVLTFYVNQENELRKRIRRITQQPYFSKFHKNNTDIFLYTVDKFQGQEADLVLLGFTKCSRNAFYNSPNRLNVALTRARYKLVLFGNKPYLKKSKLKAMRELATNFESVIKYERW